MDGGLAVVTNPMVDVRLTSTLSSFVTKRRFNRGITVAELKGKMEMIVGVSASCMELELFDVSDQLLQKMDDNEALMGSYAVDDNCRIHVIDRSGRQMGEFDDVQKVEKYEISDETYDKKTDSARSFMKKHHIGHFNEEEVAKKKAELAARQEARKDAADAISVGSRCKVQIPGQSTKLGTVMFVGTTDFKRGYWVGVKYDEPLGKNNGIIGGKQYFECEDKYGGFVMPEHVTVGDFPEEDYGLDEI
ncbi:tubulin-folding cofactor B [Brachionichthys hirsutus]|uniref:tubulin-folding cofactor B n=1 Tax=Brachionichthys hirsutus TaxID=412623 RepID=UPI003604DB2F